MAYRIISYTLYSFHYELIRVRTLPEAGGVQINRGIVERQARRHNMDLHKLSKQAKGMPNGSKQIITALTVSPRG